MHLHLIFEVKILIKKFIFICDTIQMRSNQLHLRNLSLKTPLQQYKKSNQETEVYQPFQAI
jgi:hypothetical protein